MEPFPSRTVWLAEAGPAFPLSFRVFLDSVDAEA
jgi:hypothetical protein